MLNKANKFFLLIFFSFIPFYSFWLIINLFQVDTYWFNLFTHTYGITALVVGVFAFFVSKKWGGFSSIVGRSLIMFSIGLLLQAFGQFTYTFYALILEVSIPYPSLGDVGYFGSIFFYAYGAWLVGKAAGSTSVLKRHRANLVWVLLIPGIVLFASYKAFLIGHQFNYNQPLIIFLDFGYPLGQAFYISIAILALILTWNMLGGIMRYRVILILSGLFIQYLADYTFLYQVNRGTWNPGELNELIYLTSYLVMAVALVEFNEITNKLKQRVL